MVDFVQTGAKRGVGFESPLGKDVVLAEDVTVIEEMNEDGFVITVNALAKQTLAPDQIIGKNCNVSLRLETGADARRWWSGDCWQFDEGPPDSRGLRHYQIELRPESERLKERVNSKIWQNKTSIEVLQELFAEHGCRAPKVRVLNPPLRQRFSQQMNMSDWDYIKQRLQTDGIGYFFDHTGGAEGSVSAIHTMVVFDDATGYNDGDTPQVRFASGASADPHISKLTRNRKYSPGKATVTENNFKTPNAIPKGSTPSLVNLPGNAKSEIFISTAIGGYGSGDASDNINNASAELASKLFIKACEAEYETNTGESDERSLKPGYRFTPYDKTNPGAGFEQLVIKKIKHYASHGSYDAGEKDGPDYHNEFQAIPSRTHATPHRTVQKPVMLGVDVAIVVGPPGEEIFVDDLARVRIAFKRNRDATYTDADSCPVRVVQNWAGTTYGGLILPRIGMHVLVAYESGDPDRPIIVGYMTNPVQVQSYKLPGNKTRSTFRTKSYKAIGFNELTFEDATAAERLFVHAQKDHATRVLNNRTARVDQHDVYSVGGNRSVEVAHNQKHEVGGSLHTTVGGTGPAAEKALSGVASIAGQTAGLLQQAGDLAGGGGAGLASFAGSIGGSALGFLSGAGLGARQGVVAGSPPGNDAGEALAKSGDGVGQDVGSIMSMGGVMNTVVSLFQSNSVGVARAEQVGLVKVTNVGQAHVHNIGKALVQTIGKSHVQKVGKTSEVNVGKTLDITVGEKVTITCGKSQFTMDKEGNIVLHGVNIHIKADGHVQVTGDTIDKN